MGLPPGPSGRPRSHLDHQVVPRTHLDHEVVPVPTWTLRTYPGPAGRPQTNLLDRQVVPRTSRSSLTHRLDQQVVPGPTWTSRSSFGPTRLSPDPPPGPQVVPRPTAWTTGRPPDPPGPQVIPWTGRSSPDPPPGPSGRPRTLRLGQRVVPGPTWTSRLSHGPAGPQVVPWTGRTTPGLDVSLQEIKASRIIYWASDLSLKRICSETEAVELSVKPLVPPAGGGKHRARGQAPRPCV